MWLIYIIVCEKNASMQAIYWNASSINFFCDFLKEVILTNISRFMQKFKLFFIRLPLNFLSKKKTICDIYIFLHIIFHCYNLKAQLHPGVCFGFNHFCTIHVLCCFCFILVMVYYGEGKYKSMLVFWFYQVWNMFFFIWKHILCCLSQKKSDWI